MGLFENVFQALYGAYRVALALYRGVDLFWSVVVTAVRYTLGAVIRLIFIVAIEGGTLYGAWWLLSAAKPHRRVLWLCSRRDARGRHRIRSPLDTAYVPIRPRAWLGRVRKARPRRLLALGGR